MRQKKSLGQHFLTNPKIHEHIVEAAEIKPGEMVVEIGPGSGLLTDHLLAAGARVIAVEKDTEFVKNLREKYKNKNIEIIEADVLNFKLLNFKLSNYKLVGNLPYYLTSHLLRIILQEWPQPKCIVFMVQKEVAKRMTAKPPRMNMLAVLVQSYAEPKIIKIVKAGNFSPPPKVDSAIVKLVPLSTTHYSLLPLAAQGFAHPRKKLANNLPIELLENAGIDPNRRAETLTLDEWKKLSS